MILKKLVATVGKYTDRDGNTKKRYVTIGHIHDGEHGEYITLDPAMSISAVFALQKANGISKAGDDRVYVNMYEDKPKENHGFKERKENRGFDDDVPY